MAVKKAEIGEIRCCRCDALLAIETYESSAVTLTEVRLENKGSFKANFTHGSSIQYDDLCPKCHEILENLMTKAGKVRRGQGKKKKIQKG